MAEAGHSFSLCLFSGTAQVDGSVTPRLSSPESPLPRFRLVTCRQIKFSSQRHLVERFTDSDHNIPLGTGSSPEHQAVTDLILGELACLRLSRTSEHDRRASAGSLPNDGDVMKVIQLFSISIADESLIFDN